MVLPGGDLAAPDFLGCSRGLRMDGKVSASRSPRRRLAPERSGAGSAGAPWLLAAVALALSAPSPPACAGELFVGVLAHDFDIGLSAAPRENHTTDVELG